MAVITVQISPSAALEEIVGQIRGIQRGYPSFRGNPDTNIRHYIDWLEDLIVNHHENIDSIDEHEVKNAPANIRWQIGGGKEISFMPSSALQTINQLVKQFASNYWATEAVSSFLSTYGNKLDCMLVAYSVEA